jgi:hypothetical protein
MIVSRLAGVCCTSSLQFAAASCGLACLQHAVASFSELNQAAALQQAASSCSIAASCLELQLADFQLAVSSCSMQMGKAQHQNPF